MEKNTERCRPTNFKHSIYYWTSKIFFGQVHGHLLVSGQVENFTISQPCL